MTQPQPAPLVDLEELERQLSADVHAEDYKCPRCECMTTGDNESESVFCQDCAYDVAENVVPLLLQELRALRAERERTRQALLAYTERHGWEHDIYAAGDYEVDCPEDDTCDCPYFPALNAAMLPTQPEAGK